MSSIASPTPGFTAATASAPAANNARAWLRDASFDWLFIFGAALIALASAVTAVFFPAWFPAILLLDLWLLGYHHVIATYTRIFFDSDSLQEHRKLAFVLPWFVLAATIAVAALWGLWAIITIYLYWQWFHYTRQSYGIVRIYSRKMGLSGAWDVRLTHLVVYLVPFWGILYRSWQAPGKFLGSPVAYLPVPEWVVLITGVLAAAATLVWAVRQAVARRLGSPLTWYVLTHLAVFLAGYAAIENIDHGWLALNVWHNVQYLLIVWMYNNNRFRNGVESKHPFLSTISQATPGAIAAYLLACLATTLAIYGVAFVITTSTPLAAIPLAAAVLYQTINFHHYLVDGVIWKVRKKEVRQTLRLAD